MAANNVQTELESRTDGKTDIEADSSLHAAQSNPEQGVIVPPPVPAAPSIDDSATGAASDLPKSLGEVAQETPPPVSPEISTFPPVSQLTEALQVSGTTLTSHPDPAVDQVAGTSLPSNEPESGKEETGTSRIDSTPQFLESNRQASSLPPSGKSWTLFIVAGATAGLAVLVGVGILMLGGKTEILDNSPPRDFPQTSSLPTTAPLPQLNSNVPVQSVTGAVPSDTSRATESVPVKQNEEISSSQAPKQKSAENKPFAEKNTPKKTAKEVPAAKLESVASSQVSIPENLQKASAKEPNWQQQLRAEIESCEKKGFFDRVICREKARWKYCDPNRWDTTDDCMAGDKSR